MIAMIAVATRLALAATIFAGGVTLRDREASPSGQVTSVSLNGVMLKDSTLTTELSWDRVAAVDGEFAAKAAEFSSFSEKLWRARKRLERGDLVLAEPSLESLATEYPSVGGPTGLLLHSTRVSCRLLRGVQAGAIDPYAHFIACMSEEELRGIHTRPPLKGLDAMPPRIRPSGILIPDLPPMWIDVPSLRLVIDFKTDVKSPQAIALVNLYIAAAKFESDQSAPMTAITSIDAGDDGDLVREIVVARAGDKEQRAKAREALARRIKPGIEDWRESWVRVGIGRSLLREESVDEKLTGIAEMLHAPARFAHATPYVAGLALAEAAVTLRAISDRAEADSLIAELRENFPRHPALDYRPIREWHISPGTKTVVPVSPAEPAAPAPTDGGAK